jgi:hypothetical protein
LDGKPIKSITVIRDDNAANSQNQESSKGYRPPSVPGDIYIVARKTSKGQLSYIKVEWGEWQLKEPIEVIGKEGIVLRLKHTKPDSYPLTVTTDGEILDLKQYQNGEAPKQWADPQYLQIDR